MANSRRNYDDYPTPIDSVNQLLDVLELPQGRWLEPCAGDGRIIEAVNTYNGGRTYRRVNWTANELRRECKKNLVSLIGKDCVHVGDFLDDELPWLSKYKVTITNPPYMKGMPLRVVKKCLSISSSVVMLLRLDFLASVSRYEFMRDKMPDVYVVPDRIKFVDGKN